MRHRLMLHVQRMRLLGKSLSLKQHLRHCALIQSSGRLGVFPGDRSLGLARWEGRNIISLGLDLGSLGCSHGRFNSGSLR